MNITGRKIMVSFLLLVVLLLFAGCGSKLDTRLEIDAAFSGVRTITIEVKPQDFDKIEGGSVAVERLIRAQCPEEMTPSGPAVNGDGNSEYTFTIRFSSQEEYIQKVEKLLVRTPVVQFSRPDNLLASGFRVSEDFTSGDLLQWLKDAISDEGLASGSALKSLWELDETILIYEGQEYAAAHQIQVDRIESYAVSKISIDTVAGEEIARTITIDFPAATVNALGDRLTGYFSGLIPDGVQTDWSDNGRGKTLRVAMTAATAEEFADLSRLIFSSGNQSVAYRLDQEGSTPLRDQRLFQETMDLSAFSSGGDKGVRLEYRYENQNGNELLGGTHYRDGTWKEDGTRDGMVYTYSTTTALLNVKIQTARQYYISGGEIDTTRTDDAEFERQVILCYDAQSQSGGAEYAQTFYQERLGSDAEGVQIAVDIGDAAGGESDRTGQASCTLTLTGSDSEISTHLGKVFGTGTFFTYSRGKGALNFKYSSTFTDHVDLSGILEGDSKNAPVQYVLDMGAWETIEAFHCLVKDGNGKTQHQQDYFPDEETGVVAFTMPDGRVEINAAGTALNWTGIAIIGGIVLCILMILIFIIVIVINSDRSGGDDDDPGLQQIADDEERKLRLKAAEQSALSTLR